MADPEPESGPSPGPLELDVQVLTGRERYALLTSLVVPRPIAWVSTWGPEGRPNLGPFSYFAALSATPALVGISIGTRAGRPKDTLVNLRATRALCINVVTQDHLEAMNLTSAEVGPDVDEFRLTGLEAVASSRVSAPYVASCPAVLECRVHDEVALPGGVNTFVVAEVVGARVDSSLVPSGGYAVDPERLAPVGRLGGSGYMLPDAFRHLPRP